MSVIGNEAVMPYLGDCLATLRTQHRMAVRPKTRGEGGGWDVEAFE